MAVSIAIVRVLRPFRHGPPPFFGRGRKGNATLGALRW